MEPAEPSPHLISVTSLSQRASSSEIFFFSKCSPEFLFRLYPSHRPLLIKVFESSSLIIPCISKEWEDICAHVKLGGIVSFVLNRANTRWRRTRNPVLAHSNVSSHILFEFPGPFLSPKKPP